ncbi:hypothetical protein ACM9XC_12765 [Xanthomonas sacchari]
MRLRSMFVPIFFLLFCSCSGGPLSGQKDIYRAINQALIREGACESIRDCQDKRLVFWESSNNTMYFNIYSSGDMRRWVEIEVAVAKVKRDLGIPGKVRLSFFKESKYEALNSRGSPDAIHEKEIL